MSVALAPVDLGWVAGIIEGEGSISIRFGPKNAHWVVIRVAMTDRDVVERLHRVVGCGRLTSVPARRPRCLTQYQWSLAARSQTEGLMRLLLPLMGTRRAAKMTEALDYLAKWTPSDKRGENNNASKLTDSIVRRIRQERLSRPAAQIAKDYGLAYQTVYKIVTGKSWGHVLP